MWRPNNVGSRRSDIRIIKPSAAHRGDAVTEGLTEKAARRRKASREARSQGKTGATGQD